MYGINLRCYETRVLITMKPLFVIVLYGAKSQLNGSTRYINQ